MLVMIAEGTYYAYGHHWLHTACLRSCTYCAYGHRWWDKEFLWSLLLACSVPVVTAGGTYCNYCHLLA